MSFSDDEKEIQQPQNDVQNQDKMSLSWHQRIIEGVGQDFNQVKPLLYLSERLGIKTGQLVIPAAAVLVLLVFTGIASNFLITVLGFCYPAYMSFKALESNDDQDIDVNEHDDAQWLTYWIIFSFFRVTDCVGGMLLQFIPFYHPLKLMFLVYLYHPRTRGATTIYKQVLEPYLSQWETLIDENIHKAKHMTGLTDSSHND